jgi:inositol hexakisphosphate/diphosphoinositol-pentakisphosphate kinase
MSKIPDVYDCCKYDAIHSQPSLGLTRLQECYKTAQVLSEFVAPAEYGMTRMQRLDIGSTICRNLMDKIARDIETALPKRECDTDASETDEDVEGDGAGIRINPDFIEDVDFIDDQIKTRLYFTSESHVHGIINSLRYCHYAGDEECSSQPRHEDGQHSPKTPGHQPNPLLSEEAQAELNSVHEFDYLSQIIFKVYEHSRVADPADPSRFEVRIGISPGVTGLGQDRQCQPVQWLACPDDFLKCDTFVAMLRSLTARVDRRAHQEPEKRPKVDKSS